nr:MAG TPA: hypothetical protein [Caudoviricetes sp.]DAS76785.1 MAG TPA: hypothetical protein [Caudoviricetes sp.]
MFCFGALSVRIEHLFVCYLFMIVSKRNNKEFIYIYKVSLCII